MEFGYIHCEKWWEMLPVKHCCCSLQPLNQGWTHWGKSDQLSSPPGGHTTREASPAHQIPSWKSCKPTLNSSSQTPLTTLLQPMRQTGWPVSSDLQAQVLLSDSADQLQFICKKPQQRSSGAGAGSCSQILAEDRWQCLTLH